MVFPQPQTRLQTAPANLLWDDTTNNGSSNNNNNNKPINKTKIKVETLLIRKNKISTLKSTPHVNRGGSLPQSADPGFQFGDSDRIPAILSLGCPALERAGLETLSLGLWDGEQVWGWTPGLGEGVGSGGLRRTESRAAAGGLARQVLSQARCGGRPLLGSPCPSPRPSRAETG